MRNTTQPQGRTKVSNVGGARGKYKEERCGKSRRSGGGIVKGEQYTQHRGGKGEQKVGSEDETGGGREGLGTALDWTTARPHPFCF